MASSYAPTAAETSVVGSVAAMFRRGAVFEEGARL